MILDLEAATKVLSLLSLIVSLSAAAYAWFASRRKDVDKRLEEGSKRMDRHDLRLQSLEQTVQTMPNKDDMHRVELSIGEIAGDIRVQTATLSGMFEALKRTEAVVSRHEDHLLKGS